MVPVLLSLWQMEPAVCRLKISLRHTDSITNRENLSDHSPSFAIVIHRPLARLLSASHSVRAHRASMMQESCKSVIKTRCETLDKRENEMKQYFWIDLAHLPVVCWFLKKNCPLLTSICSPISSIVVSKMNANKRVMPRLPPNQRYKTDRLFSYS